MPTSARGNYNCLMAPITKKLLQQALALPEDARMRLAEALLESVDLGPAEGAVGATPLASADPAR